MKEPLESLGYEVGMRILKAEDRTDVIESLANFSLIDFVRASPGSADPREHPNPDIARHYKDQIVHHSLGFVHADRKLFPSSDMFSFFSGYERAARVVYRDLKKRKQGRKKVKRDRQR